MPGIYYFCKNTEITYIAIEIKYIWILKLLIYTSLKLDTETRHRETIANQEVG